MSISTDQANTAVQATIEGAGVRLRARSASATPKSSILSSCSTTFATRTPRITSRVSLAPASRDRNHHLRPRGNGEPRDSLGNKELWGPVTCSG